MQDDVLDLGSVSTAAAWTCWAVMATYNLLDAVIGDGSLVVDLVVGATLLEGVGEGLGRGHCCGRCECSWSGRGRESDGVLQEGRSFGVEVGCEGGRDDVFIEGRAERETLKQGHGSV